jgi:hypothetical protein
MDTKTAAHLHALQICIQIMGRELQKNHGCDISEQLRETQRKCEEKIEQGRYHHGDREHLELVATHLDIIASAMDH